MTDFICSFINCLVTLCCNILPDFNFESSTYDSVRDGFIAICNFITDVNFIVPLSDILIIIQLKVTLSLVKMGLFSANWVIRRVADIIP